MEGGNWKSKDLYLMQIKMNKPLTDTCSMPFGEHADKDMEDVPASYLIWYYDQNFPNQNKRVMEYVKENMDALRKEL